MSENPTYVIVGGGLAGAKTAEALRDNGFTGAVVLVSAESHLPYERPPLSKEYVAGKQKVEDFTVFPAAWYRDHDVDLRSGTTATSLDRSAKNLTLADGSTLDYDKLALATGSRSRRLPIPGADSQGVHYLRTLDDADRLIAALRPGGRLVVIGAGWIGLEITAAAREHDMNVTVVEVADLPLRAVLGPEMGTVFADLHRAHDVDFRFGTRVDEIVIDDGRATGVRFSDGSTLDADAVLVAVGAAPNIELAADAGLDTGSGVLVDEALATSDPDIVAVGDIAEQQHPVLHRRIRVEHWETALDQPATAAKTMLGRAQPYTDLPYFFTDQYDLGMEYVGYAPDYARVVTRGDVTGREFIAFWLDADDRVLAGMNVNIWDVTDNVKALITSGRPVDPERLTDLQINLDDVHA